jgi:hypothetical protein
MTQFIIHSSLDMLEEAQWMGGNMYATYSVSSGQMLCEVRPDVYADMCLCMSGT